MNRQSREPRRVFHARLMPVFVALLATLVTTALTAPSAHAKTERIASYSYEKVWPATLRFLRINEGHEIIEKDAEAGYVIFQLADEGKVFRGTLELVRVEKNERPSVRLVLRIADRPSYMEQGILRRLLQKLREELGAPAPPRPPPEKKDPAEEKPSEGEHRD